MPTATLGSCGVRLCAPHNMYRKQFLRSLLKEIGVPAAVYEPAISLVSSQSQSSPWYGSPPSITYPSVSPLKRTSSSVGVQSQTRTKRSKKSQRERSNAVNMISGYYAKPFRKGVVPVSKFLKYGHVVKTEHGLELSANECAYFGHGPAIQQILKALCGAILRKVLAKRGVAVRNPVDPLFPNAVATTVASWYFKYRTQTDNITVNSTGGSVLPSDTFKSLRDQIEADFRAQFTVRRGIEFISFHFDMTTGTTQPLNAVVIDLQTLMLDMYFKSVITIQNRSIASSGVASANELLTDVENNPIIGKVYMGHGNMLEPRNASWAGPIANTSFVSDNVTGLINFNSSDVNVGSDLTAQLRHPPSANFFKSLVKVGNTRLNPGQIRRGYLNYSFKGSLKKFINKTITAIEYVSSEGRMSFGKCEMYAFELLCDSRVAEEPDVKIGASIRQDYGAKCWNYIVGMPADYTEY